MKLQDPKPTYVEGQAPPNDNCAANHNCPAHKMNSHLNAGKDSNTSNDAASKSTKDKAVEQSKSVGKHERYDDAIRDKDDDDKQGRDTRVLDTLIGSLENE